MSYRWLLPAVLVGGFAGSGAAEEPKPAPERVPDYVRVTIEVRGTLQVEKDAVRVRLFKGGSCLFIQYEVWDLDFGKDEELRKAAEKLHGKTVILTGEPHNRVWGFIESNPPIGLGGFAGAPAPKEPPPQPRQLVRVKSVKAADGK